MLYLSLGENCLSDDLVRRNDLKSFSTPYSHCRTNIDYALSLESQSYEGLLDLDSLCVGDAWGKRVIRSTRYCQDDGVFEASCSRGFEFTHHDPISSKRDFESFGRKIARLQSIRGRENVCFFYHHRISERTNLARLRGKLGQFADFYTSEHAHCKIVLYYQRIIVDPLQRGVECVHDDSVLTEFRFNTIHAWGGANPDHLWARVDDDLIGVMLKQVAAWTAKIGSEGATISDVHAD